MDIKKTISDLAAKAAAANPQNEGDYIGEDGLLYCGKCHAPKQVRLKGAFAKAIESGVMCYPCVCETEKIKCEREESQRRQKEIERIYKAPERQSYCFSDERYKDSTFSADKGYSPQAIKAAHYYVDNFEVLSAANMGLMFLGNVGTGKTFAACFIANALIDKGYRAWVITTGDLIRTVEDFNTRDEAYYKLRESDLLILDDVGVQYNSGHNLELLFSAVDARDKSKKPLIITSNLTPADFKNKSNLQIYRVYNRIDLLCSCPISPVVLTGKSIRDEIARAKHNSTIEGMAR